MLDPSIKDKEGLPLTCRAVFIVGPDKKLKLSLNYPASVGRNMDEIVRVVDALQLSAKYSVVRALAPTSCFLPDTQYPVFRGPAPGKSRTCSVHVTTVQRHHRHAQHATHH